MAMNKILARFQPLQLYIVLTLTVIFYITELIFSHITHSLTLLMDSYHMLCNIMALTGCLITMKYGNMSPSQRCNLKKSLSENQDNTEGEELKSKPCIDDKASMQKSTTQDTQLTKLKNTFGWARIDVISMLMCCVFLASFCFSIVVEALQTLIHINHQDAMHLPIYVLCIGACGVLLNGFCYLLIGGYTFHQGSFLYVTESGDVVLSKVVVNKSVEHGERRLSRTKYMHARPQKQRQGLWEIMRDVNGSIIVIVCAILIYLTDQNTAKYIDPALSFVSAFIIMILSYPYMKESCLILLQTIPDTINIDVLKVELLNHFPDILNVHDFHIWQLTASKIISTVHLIFESPKVYSKIKEDLKDFFTENGISHVTIQPEFYSKYISTESLVNKVSANCMFSCQGELCKRSHCCPEYFIGKKILSESKQNMSCLVSKKVEIVEKSVVPNDNASPDCNVKKWDEELRNQINLNKNENVGTEITVNRKIINCSGCQDDENPATEDDQTTKNKLSNKNDHGAVELSNQKCDPPESKL